MIELAPSILAADFARLGEQVTAALEWGTRRIHVDVMDGHFVPNISIGPAVTAAVAELARAAGAIVEVHLMITEPERYIHDFVRAGGNLILVHVETCPHLHRSVQMIHQLGVEAGVVLNPASPIVLLEEILPDIEQILMMTVNPGFGEQEYISDSTGKIRRMRAVLDEQGLAHVPIEVDGGVHPGTIGQIQAAGAQIAVAGSAVFNKHASVAANLDALRAACAK